VPIPRIEHNDPQNYFVMENIILSTNNLMPNVLEVALKNRAVFGLRKKLGSYLNHGLTLNLYQMHAFVQDVPFYFKRKTGFPKLKEHGVADITVRFSVHLL
jgi:hypothetical protein